MNTVQLIGNLTADPTPPASENAPVRFSIAVNYKDSVDYFEIQAWGALGESCVKFLKKGRKVGVVARLSQNKWETSEGEKRSRIEIDATDVEFLDAPPKA